VSGFQRVPFTAWGLKRIPHTAWGLKRVPPYGVLVLQIVFLNFIKKSLTGNTQLFGSEAFVVIGIV
jgi:hypothetical protein